MKYNVPNYSPKNACYLKLLKKYPNCTYTYCEAKRCIDSLNDSSYDIGYFSTNSNCKNKDWKTSCPSLQATIQTHAQYR